MSLVRAYLRSMHEIRSLGIGTGERSLRLLSLLTAADAAEAGAAVEGPEVTATATLREALAELVWRGASAANVVDAGGKWVGSLSLHTILARGREAQ